MSSSVVALLALAVVSGCGGATKSPSSDPQSASLSPAQSEFVAFYNALAADFPARKASLEAALRLNSAINSGQHRAVRAARAIREYASDANAWQRAMRSLPAGNSELASIRSKFARAADDELRYAGDYAAVVLAASEGKSFKAPAERGEAEKAALKKATGEASDELNAVENALGGASAFQGRMHTKPAEELVASMRQEAGK